MPTNSKSAPGRIRTSGPLVRSQELFQSDDLPNLGKVAHAFDCASFSCRDGLSRSEMRRLAYLALRESGDDDLADLIAARSAPRVLIAEVV